jgi:NAD(P)H-hydrate repair Nnr-like enzyme with NAD(P)H-hydrate dehydratase domain
MLGLSVTTLARQWTQSDVAQVLRAPTDRDHKYSRGVLGVRTGSDLYPGAAVLGVEAAWRTGLGMVRYLGPAGAAAAVLQRRPETVTAPGDVQAWLIGSGTDAELRTWLGLDPAGDDPQSAAAETAAALGGVVLLKGAETFVAAPDGTVVGVRAGTPWLATAGTGDVLGGVIAALLAGAVVDQSPDQSLLLRSAASGAWLHGRAGALASQDVGGGPITALDLAAALPRVVADVLAGRGQS